MKIISLLLGSIIALAAISPVLLFSAPTISCYAAAFILLISANDYKPRTVGLDLVSATANASLRLAA